MKNDRFEVVGHPEFYITCTKATGGALCNTYFLHRTADDTRVTRVSAISDIGGTKLLTNWITSDIGKETLNPELLTTSPPPATAIAVPKAETSTIVVLENITLPAIIEALKKQSSLLKDEKPESKIKQLLQVLIDALVGSSAEAVLSAYRELNSTLRTSKIRDAIETDLGNALDLLKEAAKSSSPEEHPELVDLAKAANVLRNQRSDALEASA